MAIRKVDNAAARLLEIKEEKKALAEEEEAMKQIILETLDSREMESYLTSNDDKVTIVSPVRVAVDEAKLSKAIGAKAYAAITTRVLDSKKLEEACARGTIDRVVVATCSTETPTKRYPLVTPNKTGK